MSADHPLHRVFAPRSIALVGAKDSGRLFMGTGAVLQALERIGFDGDVHFVNRGGVPVNGMPAARSVSALGAPIDMAAVLVPATAVPEVLPDVVSGGAAGATLLASGLAETGPEGAALQQRIGDLAREAGVQLIGPNCLGFLNLLERTGVWFSPYPQHLRTGSVAIVSQSGGVGDAIMECAAEQGVGLSHVITTGNEPTLAVADVLDYLLSVDEVKAIAVFAEAIRKPELLVKVARRARERGVGIVMLKAGRSALGARNALTHTGSLAGDDAVTDAVLAQLGIERVDSLEDLVATAHLIASVGPLARDGVGVVALSGGGCGIFADAAEREALELPAFTAGTIAALRGVVGDFATPQNPFDVTAAAGDSTFADVIGLVAQQGDFAAIAVLCNVPTHLSGATPDVERLLRSIAAGMAEIDIPAVLIAQTSAHAGAFGREAAQRSGVDVVLPGLDLGTAALARLTHWSAWLRGPAPALLDGLPVTNVPDDPRALSEWVSRATLERFGVPFAPALLAASPEEAVAAWRAFDAPVVVKGVSALVAHKSDVGAVRLGLHDEAAVREAASAVSAAIERAGGGGEGVLVAPMESGGFELIVGVTADPIWGPVLVVGAGGVYVEILRDNATRVLPVSRGEIAGMLASLASAPLLAGARGRPAVDTESVIDAIHAIARAGIEPGIASLEVNPLLARASGAVGLDALVVVGSVA